MRPKDTQAAKHHVHDTLSPCPFCGADGLDQLYIELAGCEDEPARIARCFICGASGPVQDEDSDGKTAEELWNQRV